MNKIVFAFAVLLTGCAALSDPYVINNCSKIAMRLGKTGEWEQSCLMDQNTYNAGIYDFYSKISPSELCGDVGSQYGNYVGDIAQQVASRRKIDCSKSIKVISDINIQKQRSDVLCSTWYNRDAHPAGLESVDEEIRRRGVDCVSLLNNQKEANRREACARWKRREQEKAESTADFMRNRAVSTKCNVFGNQLDCTTQPSSGPDLSVFNKIKTAEDFRMEEMCY